MLSPDECYSLSPKLVPRKTKKQRAQTLSNIYKNPLSLRPSRSSLPASSNPRRSRKSGAKMLKAETPIKSSMSPFNPLPVIGQIPQHEDDGSKDKSVPSLLVLDVNKNILSRPSTVSATPSAKLKLRDALKPLTLKNQVLNPLIATNYKRLMAEETSAKTSKRPQQLLRENTYDVIYPIYVSGPKLKKRDSSITRRNLSPMVARAPSSTRSSEGSGLSESDARERFKKAARDVAKLRAQTETGKLLNLREREKFYVSDEGQENYSRETRGCSGDNCPVSPTRKLSKLSEIFQNLQVNGRNRDKVKRENNWF